MEEAFSKQHTLPHLTRKEDLEATLPSMIGPYKVEGLLSAGGMSLLYLGLHPETHTPLALKVISPQYAANEEITEQFLRESEIIALTDHPNIVKLYGQGKWDGGLYIAMEMIRGVSLRQFIVQNSLTLKRALDIILQVAYALLHLHTHGVIHRDLKPENILITETGQVKVIDFGIAQLAQKGSSKSQKTLKGGVMGTPSYMSPEQIEDPSKVGFNTDLYALAVIAYELIIGKLSYGQVQLSLLPDHLRDIIAAALHPSPKERTHDVVDFITSISDYMKSHLIMHTRPGEDELHEVLENLSRAQTKLLPEKLDPGPDFDIGIAISKSSLLFGLYYDSFKLPDGNALILLAESKMSTLEAVVYISSLRSMVRSLILPYLTSTDQPFLHTAFVQQLNELISSDPLKQTFGLSSLFINLHDDRFSFISAGETPLWHLSQMAIAPRLLINHDPLLGENPHHRYDETSDNWYEGDTLLFHSFNNFFCSEKESEEIEEVYRKAIVEFRDLSCKNQAESVYKKISDLVKGPAEKQPKAFLSIQRI